MSFFPETLKEVLAGRTVRLSYLVELQFSSGSTRLWTGYGSLVSGGFTWSGVGDLGSLSNLEQAVNGQAPETTLVLSGISSTLIPKFRDEFPDEADGRPVRVYIQYHNEVDDQPLTLFNQPYAVWSGRMKTPTFRGQDESTREIALMAESLFSLRAKPNSSLYTDSDLKQRHPNDRGLESIATLKSKVVTWPDF